MIIQSIDLMGGQAVQLRQGKDLVLTAPEAPEALLQTFNRTSEVAVIDLDAALGKGNNQALIRQLCQLVPASSGLRVGGGIRDAKTAEDYLRAGASRIIIGTAATPELLQQLPPQRVMVAIDHRDGVVVDQGWTNATTETFMERAERLAPYCGGFLCTFVADEGGMGGMDLETVKAVASQCPRPVTVAGGVASTAEAIAISQLGIDVQVGMALYTGKLDAVETLIGTLDWDKMPLIPTVVQDVNGQVLMLAYSNQQSLQVALSQGKGVYFSRSRQALWEKGATSGQTQRLLSARLDCDRDSLLFVVEQAGVACHTQAYSCFGSHLASPQYSLPTLYNVLKQRKQTLPEGSFTAKLFNNREKLLRKLMEEAFEVSVAAGLEKHPEGLPPQKRRELVWELGDLLFFLSMVAVDEGIEWPEIVAELAGRRK
jgi:phosphoribosyl-AMP cyclohydrolase / phosphoribosyl-ATP pyrophosphohydrolase